MLTIALVAMCAAVLAVHIGLAQTLIAYAAKICSCARCSAFWTTLIAMLIASRDIAASALFAILMAYTANYFALLLIVLQRFYDALWQKLKKKR